MPDYITGTDGKLVAKSWVPLDQLEPITLEQVKQLENFPPLFGHAALMPDAHYGLGATIGSVIPAVGAVIPSAVGVDIGCGMVYCQSKLHIDDVRDFLPHIVHQIKRTIPVGFRHRELCDRAMAPVLYQLYKYPEFKEKCEEMEKVSTKPVTPQLGTLGGGNHFIELQVDEEGKLGVMIHSGSRNIGLQLAKKHIKIAQQCMEKWHVRVPKFLDFLAVDSQEGQDYLNDMKFALTFAYHNRAVMMSEVQDIIETELGVLPGWGDVVNIHHNYAALENHRGQNVWVHRKGATRVRSDITGIIPGSMGSPSYLVRGKDNDDSYHSCSHGAGRRMSRKAAKENLDLGVFQDQMAGIVSEDVNEKHLDEAPGAYKDIDTVMADQSDLIEIVKKLRPVANVKG